MDVHAYDPGFFHPDIDSKDGSLDYPGLSAAKILADFTSKDIPFKNGDVEGSSVFKGRSNFFELLYDYRNRIDSLERNATFEEKVRIFADVLNEDALKRKAEEAVNREIANKKKQEEEAKEKGKDMDSVGSSSSLKF